MNALGCSVWFDENKPLTERRFVEVIASAFQQARTIVAYLSPEIASSPWPLLEIRCGLATEVVDCQRVIFFVPDGVDVDRLCLPDDVMGTFRARRNYNANCMTELADELVNRNRLPVPRFSRFAETNEPLPLAATDRTIIRLREAIDRYKEHVGPEILDDECEPTGDLSQDPRFYVRCAEFTLENLTAPTNRSHIGQFDERLFLPRDAGQDRRVATRGPLLVKLLLAVAATSANSMHQDNRANALMLLESLASFDGDLVSERFLRMRLTREPTWEVARLCLPEHTVDGWWPRRLLGVEHQLLETKAAFSESSLPSDAAPYLHPGVRLALGDRRRDLSVSKLPILYQIAVSLHWITTLAQEAEAAARRGLALNGPVTMHMLKPIDAELSYRELHPLIAQLVTDPGCTGPNVRDCLSRVAAATDRLVQASERLGGLPLSSFTTYFFNHMLPLLGLLILTLDPEPMITLAKRTIQILVPSTHPGEVEAYHAFVDDCVAWRTVGHEGLAVGAPVAIAHGKIRITSESFRAI